MKLHFKLMALLLVFFINVGACSTANAIGVGMVFFGNDEKMHTIQKVEGLGGSTEYYLCYKTTTHFFVAGIYLSDDGYVLQEGGDTSKYIPLSQTRTVELQQQGVLPNPLPSYSIPLFEYAVGYSLWLLLVAIGGGSFIMNVFQRTSNSGRDTNRIRQLFAEPNYQEALTIARNSKGSGINEAIDYLLSCGIPLVTAQANMHLLLSHNEDISVVRATPPMQMSATEQLRNFKNMLDEGLITQDDYERKKQQLLNI